MARGRPRRSRAHRPLVDRALPALEGELEAALAEQQAFLGELNAIGAADGYVFEQVGECLVALGRADEGRPHFARAVELLTGDPSLADEPERLERLRSLAGAPDQTEP